MRNATHSITSYRFMAKNESLQRWGERAGERAYTAIESMLQYDIGPCKAQHSRSIGLNNMVIFERRKQALFCGFTSRHRRCLIPSEDTNALIAKLKKKKNKNSSSSPL